VVVDSRPSIVLRPNARSSFGDPATQLIDLGAMGLAVQTLGAGGQALIAPRGPRQAPMRNGAGNSLSTVRERARIKGEQG
jgi:hypothetical protein